VVVPTHNDGANIGPLVQRLLDEPCVGEVLVVASGCDDATVAVACRFAHRAVPVHVYVEAARSGKTAAVNFGVGRCTLPAIVVVSGDVLPAPGAVDLLVAALDEPGVGMAGGRPVPVNRPSSVMGGAVHLLWRLHHRLALRQPKLGEMVALRAEAVVALPPTSVDEACFQARLEAAGWRSRYVPEAVVRNRGPGTVADFVQQRRQIHTGHLWLRRRERYTVPSLRLPVLGRELWAELHPRLPRVRSAPNPRVRSGLRPRVRSGRAALPAATLAAALTAVGLEAWSRLRARVDYLRGKETHVWDMVASAKDPALGPDGLDARGR
jgi:biofilm PGA synthesis N-glycosyltransferase PgaC